MQQVTRADLLGALTALGVREGAVLEVHCALSSFGRVQGGAPAVISALEAAVGPEGTLFMPALRLSPALPLDARDRRLGLTSKIRILPPDAPRTAMGLVADTFRKMPGTVVGEGVFRIAARGKHAASCARGLSYVLEQGGHAVMMGVDIYKLTAMHDVEDLLPQRVRDLFAPPPEAAALYPPGEWLVEAGAPPARAWATIQDQAYDRGMIRKARVGGSDWMYFKVSDVVGLYREALLRDPLGLYGLQP